MTTTGGSEADAVSRLVRGLGDEGQRETLARCLSGTISPAVTLKELLASSGDAAQVRAMVDEVTGRAASMSRSTDSLLRDRVDELTELLVEIEDAAGPLPGDRATGSGPSAQ